VLTAEDFAGEDARENVRTFLGGVVRTAGSSSWLKDLYLDMAGSQPFPAMVNYEAVVIEANQELERRGLEPLYAIYPSDGVAIADSPLGFVARTGEDGAGKEEFFRKLQAHLLSPEVQAELMARGRRTGFGGTLEGFDPKVFRRDWGMDPGRVLAAIRFPAAETIEQALALYQEVLRKPSALGLCLDFSGSMAENGEAELKSALASLFDPATARRFLIQPTRADLFMVLPFSGEPWVDRLITARGNEVAAIPVAVRRLSADGGTDIMPARTT
jgi:Ca-activated chloride channel homolog